MKLVRLMRLFGITPNIRSKMTIIDLYHLQHTMKFEFTVLQLYSASIETFSANKQEQSRAKGEVLEWEENVGSEKSRKRLKIKNRRCEYIKMNFIFFIIPFI